MKKTAIIVLLSCIGLFISSCDDYLDEIVPQDGYSASTLFQTQDDLELFLNTIYNRVLGFSLTNGWPNRGVDLFPMWTEDGYGRRICCSGADLSSLFEFGLTKSPNQYFNPYERIRQVNEFLNYAPQAEASFTDPAEYRRLIAEARFFRAYEYHKISAFFGAVPLVLELTTEELLPRNTRLSVFEWVDAELADIANDLPESPDAGRISKWTAMSLRGRHLLYAVDWHPDTASLYSRAETVLQDVYDNSGHALVQGIDAYAALFTKAGASTSENVWTRYYSQTTLGAGNSATGLSHGRPYHFLPRNSGNGSSGTVATSRMVEAFQTSDGLDIRDAANTLYDINDPWANRDPRLEVAIIHSGNELTLRNSTDISNTYILEPHPSEGGSALDRAGNGNGNIRTGYWFKKYTQDYNWLSFNNSRYADVQYHFIRFAEVILLLAEAKLGNNGTPAEAMALVNEVRARVGMPAATATDADDALDKILYERRIEFAGEGDHRYYDIRRHRLGEEVFVGTLPGGGDKGTSYGIPLGPGGVAEAGFPQGTLDDATKQVVGPKDFNEFYYAPMLPASATQRNPMLELDPVEAPAWVSFFDE
nr:RagB/SusD family nutrient uptake outer membrane protein [Allomuricauda sp.]